MGKSQKYVVSSLLDGQSKDNKPYISSSSSASPKVWSDTQKIYTTGWYAPDVAPSTLIWLMGAKDLLEDSVPELGAFCIIFISLSKVIRNYICFVSLRSVIGPKNWGHPLKTSLHQPIQKRKKLWLGCARFPALESLAFFPFISYWLLVIFPFTWLAVVIILVSVLLLTLYQKAPWFRILDRFV